MSTWNDRLTEGMQVRASDGEKLGKISSIAGGQFIIEKGLFFKKEYIADFEQVLDVRDGEVWLQRSVTDLGEQRLESTEDLASDDTRIPLHEEQLEAQKISRETGGVNIRKDVVTEQQTVTVPVMKEHVTVERVPATGASATEGAEASFREESFTVPVREEEAVVTKRPVVREELRVHKDRRIEEVRASEDVRKEIADVDESGTARSISDADPNTRY